MEAKHWFRLEETDDIDMFLKIKQIRKYRHSFCPNKGDIYFSGYEICFDLSPLVESFITKNELDTIIDDLKNTSEENGGIYSTQVYQCNTYFIIIEIIKKESKKLILDIKFDFEERLVDEAEIFGY